MISNTLSFYTSLLKRLLFTSNCQICFALLNPTEQSICQICIAALPKCSFLENVTLQQLASTLQVSSIPPFIACLTFEEPVKTLCYSLKYGNNPTLGRVLGEYVLAPRIFEILSSLNHNATPLLLCPMPVHWRRKIKRGYNQSSALAQGCLKGLKVQGVNVKIDLLLAKSEHKKSQVSLDLMQRWSNTKDAFVQKKRAPKDALVILIDDTVTTGSSMLHAADVLLECTPSKQIFLVALAKEV